MMMFIWLLLGFGIYYLVTNKNRANTRSTYSKTPEEILKERYAIGEIDEETFERMKKNINK